MAVSFCICSKRRT